ncbi:uncharacterized protein LOC105847308 [Hydra vulgaris]|uniref:uncharacterized protein LOC105847308 n=1 Tax=Hydra vulgaris TaxID=6087 RepID=UPI000640D1FB|nr:uncharacterized protein LOC105847308 [Hydra vulgaris]
MSSNYVAFRFKTPYLHSMYAPMAWLVDSANCYWPCNLTEEEEEKLIESCVEPLTGVYEWQLYQGSILRKNTSSTSRLSVLGNCSPAKSREQSPTAMAAGLTSSPIRTSSPNIRVTADADSDVWCNGTLENLYKHRKKASDMSQTEFNQHMLNFTYVVMDALNINTVLRNRKRSASSKSQTNRDSSDDDAVEDDSVLGRLPMTTKEQYYKLEEKLKNESFVKTWKKLLLERLKALKLDTLAATTAAKTIMSEIFSQDMLKNMCYAGHKTYKEKKMAVKNGIVYITLIAVLKKLGHKDVMKIEKGLKDAMYKANDNITKEIRKKKLE